MSAPDLALREVEEHRRMVLQRVRLEKRRARLLVLLLVEELDPLLKALSSGLGDRISRLRSRGRWRQDQRSECETGDGGTGASSHRFLVRCGGRLFGAPARRTLPTSETSDQGGRDWGRG